MNFPPDRPIRLLGISTLEQLGVQHFDTWAWSSSYDWQDNYEVNWFSAPGRVQDKPHVGTINQAFVMPDGVFLLHDKDQFFDFGDFAIYTSTFNDWLLLSNSRPADFWLPTGFRGHTGMSDYTPAQLQAMFEAPAAS